MKVVAVASDSSLRKPDQRMRISNVRVVLCDRSLRAGIKISLREPIEFCIQLVVWCVIDSRVFLCHE